MHRWLSTHLATSITDDLATKKIEGQSSINIVYHYFISCFEAFPSYFMSFGISFFLSFQNCRQILNSQDIQAIISDLITNCQSQSPTVIDSVQQPLEPVPWPSTNIIYAYKSISSNSVLLKMRNNYDTHSCLHKLW